MKRSSFDCLFKAEALPLSRGLQINAGRSASSKVPFLTAGIIYAGQSSEALPLFQPLENLSLQAEALPAQRLFRTEALRSRTAPGAKRWSAVAFFLGLLESKRFGLGWLGLAPAEALY